MWLSYPSVSNPCFHRWHPIVQEISFVSCVGGRSGLTPFVLLFHSKTSSVALGTGPEKEVAQGHIEMRQVCFSGDSRILAWQRQTAYVVLYSKAGVLSLVALAIGGPGMPSHWHQCCPCLVSTKNWGWKGRDRKTFVQKVWYGLMPCLLSYDLQWPRLLKIPWFCNCSVLYWHNCCVFKFTKLQWVLWENVGFSLQRRATAWWDSGGDTIHVR